MTIDHPPLNYILCAQPRSGSNFLTSTFTALAIAGKPREHFEPRFFQELMANYHLPPKEIEQYVAHLKRDMQTPNGAFGTVLFYSQITDVIDPILDTLQHYAPLNRYDRLNRLLNEPKYIRLERRDKIAQAISLSKAQQSGVWKLMRGDQASAKAPLTYDYQSLRNILEWYFRAEIGWAYLFEQAKAKPMRIFYEDMEAQYEPTVRAVFDYLGHPLPADQPLPPQALVKQRDNVSEEWHQRFLADNTNQPMMPDSEVEWLRCKIVQLENQIQPLQAATRAAAQPDLKTAARSVYRAIVPLQARLRLGEWLGQLRHQR